MSILECYGQDRAIIRLQRARNAHRVPHSYIFQGPEGVGKKLLALEWAKLMLCSQQVKRRFMPTQEDFVSTLCLDEIEDSCGECSNCRSMAVEVHPDFHRVSRELARFTKKSRSSQFLALPVDVIREFVIEPAGSVPIQGRARIFVIEEAETMNRQAQNSLLKTLEEPPTNTFIILLTTRPDQFLPTIRSRCQFIPFNPLPVDYVYNHLLKKGIDPQESIFWAHFCEGKLGVALEYAQINIYEVLTSLLKMIADLNYHKALETAAGIISASDEFAKTYLKLYEKASKSSAARLGQTIFLQMVIFGFQNAIRFSSDNQSKSNSTISSLSSVFQRLSENYSLYGCTLAIRQTMKSLTLLEGNINPALLFESLMIDYLDYTRIG